VVAAGVRQIEDGSPVPPGTQFVPGETVYYSFQVAGYGVAPGEPDTRKVRLAYKLETFDPKGVPVVEAVDSVVDTAISEQDKEWKPKIRHEILIPPFAPSGIYKIVASVTDPISKTSTRAETIFEVSGRQVPVSVELAVLNFGFYRSEDDPKPISPAAYRAGDSLFARFDMAGYRFGERNAIDLAYDVAVLDPTGKQIYSQPDAAVEKSSSFYPKPYVPGGMSLSLEANMPKGEYTVVLAVHDRIGSRNYELREKFSVE
jgi:hypothetical protein